MDLDCYEQNSVLKKNSVDKNTFCSRALNTVKKADMNFTLISQSPQKEILKTRFPFTKKFNLTDQISMPLNLIIDI